MHHWNSTDFKALKNGDKEQLEKLYLTIKDPLYFFLLGKVRGDREIADEIFSRTIVSIVSSVNGLKNAQNLKGWVYRVAQCRYNDFFRSRREKEGNLSEQEIMAEERDSPDIQASRSQELAVFNCGLNGLPQTYREILKLKYEQNQTLAQIADGMKKKRGAIESLIVRAKERLKLEMEKCEKLLTKNWGAAHEL